MHILLSNDDGYLAPGLAALATAVQDIDANAAITVVAPESNRSGASSSLTLDRPLQLRQAANGFYYVNGTPTDCVHLAVTGMIAAEPQMVISGVNLGPNMGDDTIYSGTVAAAMEGYLLGVPAIAVSLASFAGEHFETAARAARLLAERLLRRPFGAPLLLNVNTPDRPWDELRGWRVTRLGRRHKAEPVLRQISPRGETVYWVGAAGAAADAGEGTDFDAVDNGWISVTPLQVDLTHYDQMRSLSDWLDD